MTDLKTLKDILPKTHDYCREALKAEAIKWVKEAYVEEVEAIKKNRLYVMEYWRGRKLAIIDFFNLTEEDLK